MNPSESSADSLHCCIPLHACTSQELYLKWICSFFQKTFSSPGVRRCYQIDSNEDYYCVHPLRSMLRTWTSAIAWVHWHWRQILLCYGTHSCTHLTPIPVRKVRNASKSGLHASLWGSAQDFNRPFSLWHLGEAHRCREEQQVHTAVPECVGGPHMRAYTHQFTNENFHHHTHNETIITTLNF